MATGIDFELLWRRALGILLERPSGTQELCRSLRVSQPTLSRLLAQHRNEVLVLGRARATRYIARRVIPDIGSKAPVYEIDENGASRRIAWLHAVGDRGFQVEPLCDDVDPRHHGDLPWFLDGLRPSGFLGRLVPRQHPELGLPRDIRLWTGDQTLRYLCRFGWNCVGSLVVGDEAFQLYLGAAAAPRAPIPRTSLPRRFVALANDVLAGAPPGSFAAGEQPKFLATVASLGEVLVKFSPPRSDAGGRRIADLLVAEHLAHEVMRAAGIDAAQSSLVEADERLFLSINRFDRTKRGRRGVVSLEALDAELAGHLERGDWPGAVQDLAESGVIDPALIEPVKWLSAFGSVIANSDMHAGNLSFFTRGARVLRLAPAYDMLPMMYAPQQGHLPPQQFKPPIPGPAYAGVWRGACAAGEAFWDAVATHSLVSPAFRRVAQANRVAVARAAKLARQLPT